MFASYRLASRREYDRHRRTAVSTEDDQSTTAAHTNDFLPPLFDDPVVISRIQQFHANMSACLTKCFM